jgi:hypothetical protein
VLKLLMVCEDAFDFRIASGLADRAVGEVNPSRLREALEDTPEAIRAWHGDGTNDFFNIHHIADYCDALDVKLSYGHFGEEPGGEGAQSARNAFALVRHLVRKGASIDAVLLLWDMDQNVKERRPALQQARAAEQSLRHVDGTFKIVLGCPNAMMEAWVIAGFDAGNDDERGRLQEERKKIGFSPITRSHDLDATSNKEGASAKREEPLAKKSAKRVMDALTDNDPDRVMKCWKETPLETLRERGEHNGLRDYLQEVKEILVPLFER